jgi:predicted NBD/HSP70 family sugar kinase
VDCNPRTEPVVISLLRQIYVLQPTTRRALAEHMGLRPARANMLISQLLGLELAIEETAHRGTAGRPAACLSIHPDAGRLVGLDIGGTRSRAVVTDMAGRVLSSQVRATEAVADREVILGSIARLVDTVCRMSGTRAPDVVTLGVAVRGIVDTQTGVVHDWPSVPAWTDAWRGLDVPRELGERLGIEPIFVDDTVRAMGFLAHRFGLARGSSNFLYVHLGTGVGSGVFVGGVAYSGNQGMAGELGHVTIDADGPWCSCGNRGCLEVMASTPAVLRRVRDRLAESHLVSVLRDPYERGDLTLDALIEAARSGDKLAYHILDETGVYVGRVLAIALNLLSPELVLLAGPLAHDGGIILDAVQRQVRLHALQHIWKQARILCDVPDDLLGARGAALVALNRLFNSRDDLMRFVAARNPVTVGQA